MTKNEVSIPNGTPEEREMYIKLAKKFGLKLVKTIEPIPGAVKVIKWISYCSLCENTNIQYIRILKYTDGIWKKDKVICEANSGEISKLDVHKDSVLCCLNCVDFLMSKDKMELVRMVMRSRSPALINLAVKRVLREMKKEEEEEKNVCNS